MSRRRRIIGVLAALGLAAAAPGPAWPAPEAVVFGAPAGEGSVAPSVESVGPTGYRVRIPVGEPRVEREVVHGQALDEISIPGGVADAPAGEPQLPCRTVLLRVPWETTVRATAAWVGARALGSARPVPFPYLLTDPQARLRTSPGALVAALSSPSYATSRSAAPAALLRARPTAAGNDRLLEVSVAPLHWDARTGALTAAREITIDVAWDRPAQALASGAARGSSGLTPREAIGPRYPRRPRGADAGGAARAGSVPRRAASAGAAYAGPMRVSPAREWVRIGVVRAGFYVLGPADLEAAGVAAASVDPATLRLFRSTPGDLPESVGVDLAPDSLRECAVAVQADGNASFDGADRLYFYATGSNGFGYDLAAGGNENYSETQRGDDEAVWLTWGPAPSLPAPLRIPARAAPPESAPVLTSVTHLVHFEGNTIDDFDKRQSGLRWERWFWQLYAQGTRPRFPLALPGAVPGGAGFVQVRLWGNGLSAGLTVPDHFANIYWDRVSVASASWDLSQARDLTSAGIVVHARDTLEVEIPRVVDGTDPGRFDRSYLAWFEVRYPRALVANADTLQFAGPDSVPDGLRGYAISGATDTTAVWLLDRTDPERPVRLLGAWSGTGPFTLTVEDSVGPTHRRRYSLVSLALAPRPPSIARYAPAASPHTLLDLLDPANGVDYLIVAPAAFLAAAESLAAYRSTRLFGFAAPRVAIATTDRIAAQLGGGAPDPTAIRNLLAYARDSWAGPEPSYVCLLGDASLDPKHYRSAEPDLVPTYANLIDSRNLKQYVSDDWFAFLDGPGDQVLDIAVGRLPARTAVEALLLVGGKVRAFESSSEHDPWRARVLLSADDSWKREQRDGLGNDHVNQAERKDRLHLPYPIERSKVYLNDYAFADTSHQSKPDAKTDFIAKVNQGNILVDYVGHGSDQFIADEQLFRSSDAQLLTNASRPSIFAFMSCTVGKFDALGQEGLAELLLKLPGRGAVASIAATEEAFPTESTPLNDDLVEQLFPLRPRVDSLATLGFAWARAKNANLNQTVRKYVLLGDPALLPPVPRGRGVWEKGPLDSLLRGDVAHLTGHALMPDSSADTSAGGTALIEVLGPPIRRTQIGLNAFGALVPATYEVPGPTLFRGEVPVSGGVFDVRFVVPLDGRIVGPRGRVRALLSSAGGRGVGLAVDSIRIAATVVPRTDVTPPAISILRAAGADSTVSPGGLVTIAIEDSSGVDLLGLDNAHTIFAIFDDQGSPIPLTAGFRYEPGSYTRGTVDLPIPSIAQGIHRLEVHASDTYGNIGAQTFYLDVQVPALAGDAVRLTEVFNYPNPFARDTFLHARLNQAARLTIQIFTVAGRRVREIRREAGAGETYIPWDGNDSRGEKVAIGVYLFRIVAETPAGKRTTAMGRALRTE